jgi:calcineurin-like phosphoesterase family protein
MVYFISDTHFGHKGSLKWPNGAARNFKDLNEMHETIINNWNSVVKKDDIIYFLGDFAYKCSEKQIKHFFDSLNGTIIFIKGNHDGRTLKANQKYHRFQSVHELLHLTINNKEFILCHYPIESWNGKNRGAIHLHGHTHERTPNITGNIMNVSCEVVNYTPVSIEEVINKFTTSSNKLLKDDKTNK